VNGLTLTGTWGGTLTVRPDGDHVHILATAGGRTNLDEYTPAQVAELRDALDRWLATQQPAAGSRP